MTSPSLFRWALSLSLLIVTPAFAAQPVPGSLIDGITSRADPEQSYAVYLPHSWTSEKKWPVLVLFDPGSQGSAAASIFVPAASKLGWVILSSNNTRSGAAWEPNIHAVRTLFGEVGRYSPDMQRIYLGGFSGGAMIAYAIAQQSEHFAGVIGVGGRHPDGFPETVGFAHYGFAGRHDFNLQEMLEVDAQLSRTGAVHRFEAFDGSHQWIDSEMAEYALRWMELLAMQAELREPDEELVQLWWQSEMSRFERELQAGRMLAAHRRGVAVVSSYRGLVDVEPLQARVAALERSREYVAAARSRKRWLAWESTMSRRLARATVSLEKNDGLLPERRIAGELRVRELLQRRGEGGEEGAAAARVINVLYLQLAGIRSREAFAAGRHRVAESLLRGALMLQPGDRNAWYRLGAARSRLGDVAGALEALDRAIDLGWSSVGKLMADDDYARVRGSEGFTRVLDRLEKAREP